MSSAIDLRLPVGPLAPGDARHALDRLTGVVGTGQLDEIRLLVSELVTNSVRHAGMTSGEWIEFRVDVSGALIRVEVADPGPGFVMARQFPTMYQDSGWGLYLVERIADRWGVSNEGGTCVWFEVDL